MHRLFSGQVWEIPGTAIGGTLSSAALELTVGASEHQFLEDRARHEALGFRYPGLLVVLGTPLHVPRTVHD